jgi:hypothetical protein
MRVEVPYMQTSLKSARTFPGPEGHTEELCGTQSSPVGSQEYFDCPLDPGYVAPEMPLPR